MENIRKHIEENLANTQREYDDIYYHWEKAKEAFDHMKAELESLTASLAKAQANAEYFQKLLNELNDNDSLKNR
jgi:septation ring formation regulator EzrA